MPWTPQHGQRRQVDCRTLLPAQVEPAASVSPDAKAAESSPPPLSLVCVCGSVCPSFICCYFCAASPHLSIL